MLLGLLIESLIVSPSFTTLFSVLICIEKLFFLGFESPQLINSRDKTMRMKGLNIDILFQILMQVI